MMKGIDVSKHNGTIDWKKVRADGIEFAILRAGYGKYDNQKDEKFEENYAAAKKAGIKLGAYIYSYAKSADDAKKEAQTFLKWLSGKKFEMPVIFDIEEKSQSDKGKEFVSQLIKTFCNEMEKSGYYIGVYSSKHWFDRFIDDECKNKYDCWVAQWSKENTYKGKYGMWQYSATGKVNGIRGSVDMNEAYKDYPAIIKSRGFNGFKDNSDAKPAIDKPPTQTSKPDFVKGQKITLKNTPVYISADTKKLSVRKSGAYYIYDGILINSRFRITNKPERAGKKPLYKNVTGYVNKSDIT